MILKKLIIIVWLMFSSSAIAQNEVFSGSWFDPARAGEGFVVQILDDGRALVTWFTYPPEGGEAVQGRLRRRQHGVDMRVLERDDGFVIPANTPADLKQVLVAQLSL